MDKKKFDNFFKSYSQNVDQVDQTSAFWKLSDAIILEIIKKEIGPFITNDSKILDAGGGTARWAIKINDSLNVPVSVFDRSKDMLAVASKNVKSANKSAVINLIEGDMTDMSSIPDSSFDHIVSIYSPLSFIYNQEKAISELYRVLKRGGRLLVMSHGYHNAIFSKINNYHDNKENLSILCDKRVVKWSEHVPELITHSKESIEILLSSVGFVPVKTYGIPIYVQPGHEDFDPTNQKISNISKYLDNPEIFKAIFNLEMENNSNPTVCNRGMNIFSLARK